MPRDSQCLATGSPIETVKIRNLFIKKWQLPLSSGIQKAPANYRPAPEVLDRSQKILRSILIDNIVRFWYPRIIDAENGGYRSPLDLNINATGQANKSLVAQARTVWFFSRLANSAYNADGYLNAAKHGYEFLRDRLWDSGFGGFFWEVDASGGTQVRADKHLYGQAFALYALSEYVIASEDSSATRLAQELFNLLETHAYDRWFGGFRESFRRDWDPATPEYNGYLGVGGHIKLMNTHLHLLEAMTLYYRATKAAIVRDRLVELILINSNSVVRKRSGACSDRHLSNWEPLKGARHERVSYGHDIENIWLLVKACEAAEISTYLLLDLYRTLFEYSFHHGFDPEKGGFYESGSTGKPADRRDKLYWVQAEALLGALQMYLLTRERLYWDCFSRTLDWINQYQANCQRGDWHVRVSEDGIPLQTDLYAWSAPYHQGRAMLNCLELVAGL